MARVTVEDCIDKTDSRFELVMLASQRARKIGSGAPLTVDADNDKKTVIALREIAAETLNKEELKEDLIRSNQRMAVFEDEQDVDIDLMHGEKEWGSMASGGAITSQNDMYGAEEIRDEDDEGGDEGREPSLHDLAGRGV